MKGTGAKHNVFPGSCVSTGATFPVAPVESAPMITTANARRYPTTTRYSLQLSNENTQTPSR